MKINVNVTLSSIILLHERSAIRFDLTSIEGIDTLAVGITVTDDATHIMELEVAVVERVADVLLGYGILHPQQADGTTVQSLSEGKVEVALIEGRGKPPVVQTVLATLIRLDVARELSPCLEVTVVILNVEVAIPLCVVIVDDDEA